MRASGNRCCMCLPTAPYPTMATRLVDIKYTSRTCCAVTGSAVAESAGQEIPCWREDGAGLIGSPFAPLAAIGLTARFPAGWSGHAQATSGCTRFNSQHDVSPTDFGEWQ